MTDSKLSNTAVKTDKGADLFTSASAQITPETLPAITWNQARVITTDLLARLYGTEAKRIQNNFARNAGRFEIGKHFYKLSGVDLKSFANLQPSLRGSDADLQSAGAEALISNKARSLILWTERGAARHAKMLETNAAWEVFEKLEDCYFAVKAVMEKAPYSVTPGQTLSAAEADSLRGLLTEFAESMPKSLRAQIMIQGWSKLKAHFKADYRQIPADQFTEAVSILGRHITHWAPADPKKTAIVSHAQPPAEQVALPAPTPTLVQIDLAMKTANLAVSQVQSIVFKALLESEKTWQHNRYMISFNWAEGDTATPSVQKIDKDAFVVSLAKLAKNIIQPDCWVSDVDLANLATACNQRLAERIRHKAGTVARA